MGNQIASHWDSSLSAILQTMIFYGLLSPMSLQASSKNRKAIQVTSSMGSGEIGPTNSIYLVLFLWTTLLNDHRVNGANRFSKCQIQNYTQFNSNHRLQADLAWAYSDRGELLGVLIAGSDFGLDFPTKWSCIERFISSALAD